MVTTETVTTETVKSQSVSSQGPIEGQTAEAETLVTMVTNQPESSIEDAAVVSMDTDPSQERLQEERDSDTDQYGPALPPAISGIKLSSPT